MEGLSIPLRMKRDEVKSRVAKRLTFNSFEDETKLIGLLDLSDINTAFNSFEDETCPYATE